MTRGTVSIISLGLAISLVIPTMASAQDVAMEEILIVGVRENRTSKGATGLALDIKNTPQSISVVDREMMDAFAASTINDALDMATGIQVERWETNRTNYLSRGFEIKNTQIDGVGLPNGWGLVTGTMDAFGYEKIEVIRGANGLLTGVGNASGTINYVRKRPTNSFEGNIGVSRGSWDSMRVEGDVSAPFSSSSNWAGRIVVAAEESDSYLDELKNDHLFIYGVVDGQLTENSTLAVGYSHQDANSEGNMWGGLVFTNSDGSQAEWDTSASTTQDWTYWDTVNETAFIEYNYVLPNNWDVKLSYNYRGYEDESQLFFASTTTGLDPQTGAGLTGWPGKWPTEEQAHLFDVNVNGDFDLFGETHEIILGANRSDGNHKQFTNPVDENEPAFGALPPFPYASNAIPEPIWGAKILDSERDDKIVRYYGATRINIEYLSVILGFNALDLERKTKGFGNDINEREVSPYLGLTYAITEEISAYGSYSDIYDAQDFYDITGAYLDPTKGVNYELGVKASWFDDRLLTSFAVFKAEQLGLGTFAGMNPETQRYYYRGEDVYSEGYELEVSGSVNDHVKLVFGYTAVELEDENDDEMYTWVPRDSVNFAVNAQLPQLPQVDFGLAGKWKSETSRVDGYTGIEVKQEAYALFNVFARWSITSQALLQLNVNNIADKKHITSLFEIGYYGEPRSAELSFKYNF